jgi:hypothetical protein
VGGGGDGGKVPGKPLPTPNMTSIPADSPLLKNLSNTPLGDGKLVSDQEGRKKAVPIPISAPPPSEKPSSGSSTSSSSAGGAPGGNRKTAIPSSSSFAATPAVATAANNACTECTNANKSSEGHHTHGVHVKRVRIMDPFSSSSGGTPVSPGTTKLASATSITSPSSTGPPLAPSQVCVSLN